jgi:hypothetical protein
MKSLSLMLVLMLATVGLAQAEFTSEDHDGVKRPNHSVQHLSKRPYAAPVKEVLDGATVVEEEKQKPNKLNLHMLDRKPYASQE